MPARKPSALHTRHATKAEKASRIAKEQALQPERGLPQMGPAVLHGHDVALATWRRLMRIYDQLEGVIVTRLDQDLLVDYCMMMEQVAELDQMRRAAFDVWSTLNRQWEEISRLPGKTVSTETVDGQPAKFYSFEERLDVAMKLQSTLGEIVKLDARVERKRALLKQYREALYLTPRSRAGADPKKKEQPLPPDDMQKILNEVDKFVNGPQDGQ